MFKIWLAAIGLFVILASSCMGVIAWKPYWAASYGVTLEVVEASVWLHLQSIMAKSPGQALLFSLIGLLFGVLLTIPWWLERLRGETKWWEMRDEPLDTPPRAGV